MRRHRLYCPTLNTGSVELPADEVHHAINSLRVTQGQEIVLFDGLGREGTGVITHSGKRELQVEVAELFDRPFELAHHLTLAVAIPRAPRQGYLVEKCTELGVAALWPLNADRSVVKGGESGVLKWSRRAIEAAKQSGRAWLPQIAPPRSLRDCLARRDCFDAAFMADTAGTPEPLSHALAGLPARGSLLIGIGPEGGWSDAERTLAAEAGITPVTLSPTVLRTETAAVAACAAVAMCSPA